MTIYSNRDLGDENDAIESLQNTMDKIELALAEAYPGSKVIHYPSTLRSNCAPVVVDRMVALAAIDMEIKRNEHKKQCDCSCYTNHYRYLVVD